MAKHLPTTSWPLRSHHGTYVRTADAHNLELCTTDRDTDVIVEQAADGYVLKMSRATARLLVRRINQCLEESSG